MNEFKLVPFSTENLLPNIEISGRIDRQNEMLSIGYRLQGNLDAISIDPPTMISSRKLELWTNTCFEFFVGIPGNLEYWEFNLAPSGDWNVFHLDDYRQGLQNELTFTSLPFAIDRQANSLLLTLTLDLSKIIPIQREIEVSVTMVIESEQNQISYWALTHTGTEADFHRRDSFIIKID
jgi:hypothetical protein